MSEYLGDSRHSASLYPWHRPYWERFRASWIQDRMPHALLLAGPAGMGKRNFAAALVQALACVQPQEDGRGCDNCKGCRLQRAGCHPDHLALLPAEGKQAISIDQIRQLQAHLTLKARQSRFKSVILFPAEIMTLNAANSLLKVLEEPPGETLILLITSIPEKLPVTIRSRCQQLRLALPEPQEAQAWVQERLPSAVDMDLGLLLALVKRAPLRALEYVEQGLVERRKSFIEALFSLAQGRLEPLEIAQSQLKNDLEEPLYWMSTLVEDTIRLKCGVPVHCLINRDRVETLQALTRNTPSNGLFSLWKKVSRAWGLWKGQRSINAQLLLEELLIQWSLCFNEVSHGRT